MPESMALKYMLIYSHHFLRIIKILTVSLQGSSKEQVMFRYEHGQKQKTSQAHSS